MPQGDPAKAFRAGGDIGNLWDLQVNLVVDNPGSHRGAIPVLGESGASIAASPRKALAKASKVSRPMIAAIEARHKTGGIATLKKLAAALKVDLDHLA